jgi:hypothetical protein
MGFTVGSVGRLWKIHYKWKVTSINEGFDVDLMGA